MLGKGVGDRPPSGPGLFALAPSAVCGSYAARIVSASRLCSLKRDDSRTRTDAAGVSCALTLDVAADGGVAHVTSSIPGTDWTSTLWYSLRPSRL